MMKSIRYFLACCVIGLAMNLVPFATHAQAGELWRNWMQSRQRSDVQTPVALPAGTHVVRDVAYGSDPRQRFDVYVPANATKAPVILLVHGGGWRIGDKAMPNVVGNKVARWIPRGIIVISINYRMLPGTSPLQQAQDVALALATAQRHAAEWGGAADRFVLMGHSAGAHLVALLAAKPDLARAQGARRWLGTVSLDSASLDVVKTMQGPHLPLFDQAFGSHPNDWFAVSPLQQLSGRITPFLAVCSSQRFESCPNAQAFVARAQSFGGEARVLMQDLTHGGINQRLGLTSAYTESVEDFLGSLDPSLHQRLAQHADH